MSGVLCALMLMSYAPGFLTLYPGSAASALAGAQVALADDALANIYNPAGLGFQSALSADAEYNPLPYLNAPSVWLAAAAIPVAPGVTAGVFGWGSILKQPAQDSLGFFSHEFATGFALAGKFTSSIGAGMALKYIRGYSRVGSRPPLEGDVWLADAGLRGAWPVWIGELGLGAALQNVGPRYRWTGTSEADTVPLSARAGISYVVTMSQLAPGLVEKLFRRPAGWWAEHWRLAIAYDVNRILAGERNYALFGNWENQTSSLGIEVRPVPMLAFRFGHFYPGAAQYAGGWTFGLGLDLKYVKMDIADDQALFRPWQGPDVRRRLRWTLGVEFDKLLNASRRAATSGRQG
jgi:hypothetical protein